MIRFLITATTATERHEQKSVKVSKCHDKNCKWAGAEEDVVLGW